MDRLDARFTPAVSRRIAQASRQMVDMFEHTGEVGIAPDHYGQIEDEFKRMAETAALVFGGRIIEQGKAAGFVLERKEGFADMMARLAMQYIAQEAIRRRITSIAETTRNRIVSLVEQGYEAGFGQQEIARTIRDRIPSMSLVRGALIARTEVHGAAQFGADSAARSAGLQLRKEWVASGDERTRRDHRRADGQVVGMDEPFIVGGERLMYPGDSAGRADQTINCRCVHSFIVVD